MDSRIPVADYLGRVIDWRLGDMGHRGLDGREEGEPPIEPRELEQAEDAVRGGSKEQHLAVLQVHLDPNEGAQRRRVPETHVCEIDDDPAATASNEADQRP